jgi:RNA polymerase sigma factor (TIGR02999 family)
MTDEGGRGGRPADPGARASGPDRASGERDPDQVDAWFQTAYDELRRLAEDQMRRERDDHTLQPTALLNEAWAKLAGSDLEDWSDRTRFMGVAARAMRQILVDHARRRAAAKRGGGGRRTTLAGLGDAIDLDGILALDEALDRLDRIEPRLRQVVEYRFFAGLTDAETADLMGVTRRTVQRDWAKARAWLHRELGRE